MDTRFIEVRKNISIPLQIVNNVGSYTYTINNVDFIPDEVTLKYINYSTSVGAELGSVTLIHTDLIPDTSVIGSFFGNVASQPNTTFTLRNPVKGLYNINFLTVVSDLEAGRVGEF